VGKSTAAQVIIAVIPIVGIVMGSVVVLFYLLWNYRRQMALIRTNQWERPRFDLLPFCLLSGLLLTGVGLGLTAFFALISGATYALLGGIIPLGAGAAFLAFYAIQRRAS